MSIKQNLERLKSTIPSGVELVVVSKRQPKESVLEAYEVGQRIFGENRHKELIDKYDNLPKDIEWHFIGSLQRTNVKYVVPRVALIHSVDSDKLLEEINKVAAQNSKVMDVLLEVHLAQESTKSGWDVDELVVYLASQAHLSYSNVRVCGLMAMATYTSNSEIVEGEFKQLKTIYDKIKSLYFEADDSFNIVSAGMSSDYELAIKHGANMVRIGSLLF
ncbi:MAG: YggS family pyridoxal phosphate-dependent enzyme [Rikenellaceae bacterium]